MIDWTQIVIYAIGHAFGALHVWMRLHRDAELGRSMRPEARCDLPGPDATAGCILRKGHHGACIYRY